MMMMKLLNRFYITIVFINPDIIILNTEYSLNYIMIGSIFHNIWKKTQV